MTRAMCFIQEGLAVMKAAHRSHIFEGVRVMVVLAVLVVVATSV